MRLFKAHFFWGLLSLVAGFLLLGLVVGFLLSGDYGEHIDNVTSYELANILRQGGFPSTQECKVEHSYYRAAPPPNNDHFCAYALHLETFPESLLAGSQDGLSGWQSGADTNEVHLKVLRAAQVQTTSTTHVGWLPPLEEFSGPNYYRRFVSNDPNPAAFFAYDRQKKTLYFVGYKF